MSVFQFKQFAVKQSDSAMKVGTDSVLLGSLLEADHPKQILDIGAGTGILALMMAQRFAMATVDAIEIDDAAANEAQYNVNISKWHQRIFVYKESFQKFTEQGKKYDLVISNPPYYPAEDHFKIETQQRSTARQTQALSFDDLLSGVQNVLSDDGICWMVLPAQESELLIGKASDKGLHVCKQIFIHSKLSKPFNRVVFSLSKNAKPVEIKTFLIYEEDGTYTPQYKEVTLPFLLWDKT